MMTIDEAIKHCEEVAESKRKQVENGDWEKGSLTERDCLECAKEHRQLAEWLKELKQLREQTRWIPVSERLPESSGVYIVSRWFSDGEERAILVDANYYDGDGYWYNDNRINWGRDLVTNRIIAWMPLPEPYNAEMEE